MKPDEIKAVAVTLELIRKNPPNGETWDRPGTPTLEQCVQKWLKQQLLILGGCAFV